MAFLAFTCTLAAPTVKLDSGTFIGVSSGTTSQFFGIPYAQPPCVHFLLPRYNQNVKLFIPEWET